MQQFSLSPLLDKNKIFLLKKCEIEDSLSPLFYSILPKTIYNYKKLKDIAIVNPARPRPTYNSDDLVPYVGLPETDENTKSINNVVMRPYKEVSGRNIIYPNEILFARIEPSVFNKKYIYTNDLMGYPFAFTSTEFYIVKGRFVTNEFLMAAFHADCVFNQVKRKTTGSTGRRRLDPKVFEELKIPIPNKEKQQNIISTYIKAYDQKKQNDAQAEQLLTSIDDYLLEELGITLPEPPDNNLKNRVFKTTIKETTNHRLDPFYYKQLFENNLKAIHKSKYPVKQIREITAGNLIKGTLPGQTEKGGNNLVVQISCINPDGTIDLTDLLTAKDIFSNEQKLNTGDVLIVITGATIGKVAFWDYSGDYYLGGDIVKFQTNISADSAFVYNYLRSRPIQIDIKRNITGATNGHLSPDDVNRLLIPIPPLAKQKEIAANITAIRKQAQQLKEKTKTALEKANKEIEKILLG